MFPLALALSGEQIAIVVLAVVAAVALVRLFWRADDKIEARRKHASDLAAVLKEEGYDQCSDVAAAYSIGDYSGFAAGIKHLVGQLLNSETRMALLAKPFLKQLANALKDPDKREAIKKQIAAAEAQAAPVAATAPTSTKPAA